MEGGAVDYIPQHGDLLSFSGKGCMSFGIKLGTFSRYSHVGMVGRVTRADMAGVGRADEAWADRELIFESTTMKDRPCSILKREIRGVQSSEWMHRIRTYIGRVYWSRLTPDYRALMAANGHAKGHLLTHLLLNKIGHEYDGVEAVISGGNIIKYWFPYGARDRSSLFCSEYVADCCMKVGLMAPGVAAQWSPRKLINFLTNARIYTPPRLITT